MYLLMLLILSGGVLPIMVAFYSLYFGFKSSLTGLKRLIVGLTSTFILSVISIITMQYLSRNVAFLGGASGFYFGKAFVDAVTFSVFYILVTLPLMYVGVFTRNKRKLKNTI